MDDLHHIQALLKSKRRRLRILELQSARFGSDCPAHILLEIEDLRDEVEKLQVQLDPSDIPSSKWEDLATIAYKLAESASLLVRAGSSIDVLPDLKVLYGQWLQPELKIVRITQKDQRVFLEVTRQGKGPFSDPDIYEHTILIDLGFIGDVDALFFPPEKAVQENAKKFIEKFDPYSMIMSGLGEYFLTREGTDEIAYLHESGNLDW